MVGWRVFEGTGDPRDPVPKLPPPPPWRTFTGRVPTNEPANGPGPMGDDTEATRRLGTTAVPFDPGGEVVMMVNAAIHLRRALLVTGRPGVGKSSLSYLVARELGLGAVLRWPITTRTTLQNGLYSYDALARLQAAQASDPVAKSPAGRRLALRNEAYSQLGRFLQLGPLGTALLPRHRPRVLLIDEIDKSDLDLPDDLLTVLEEGTFEIPELARYDGSDEVPVRTADYQQTTIIEKGRVTCREFPLVIMTSNGERDFPPAFLRRCLRLTMEFPDVDRIRQLVEAHLGTDLDGTAVDHLIEAFSAEVTTSSDHAAGQRAPDQLLNALFIIARNAMSDEEAQTLADRLFQTLET